MSQHDFNIANQTAANARSDINLALLALNSNSSGPTAPTPTYANMHWYDTTNNILKQRSEADDAWISIGYFDQTTNKFRILDDTQVVDASGTQTGLLGDQATAEWQSGLGTTQSLVSPANVKSAIDSLTISSPIKAWANINGANGAIRASTGITSCVRNGLGDYTITFNTGLMPDANYVLLGTAGSVVSDNRSAVDIFQLTQTTARFTVMNQATGVRRDATFVCVQFVR